MQRDYGIIKIILLIFSITIFFTQVSLARGGLLSPSGSLKWQSDYKRYDENNSDMTIYSDYKLGFTGPLGVRKVGFYNLDFNYRDYIKTDASRPTVTTYNFNTDLFPQSFFNLGLGLGKSRSEYKDEDMEDAVDTTSKHSSFSFYTPLPLGLRFGYSFNNSHQFDNQKTEINNKDNNQSIRLNKNIRFANFVTTNLSTRYAETTSEDLIKNTTTTTTNKKFSCNNSFHTRPFSLTDLDGSYSSSNKGKSINYNLVAHWKPLDSLSLRTSGVREVEKEEVGGSLNITDSSLTSRISFSARPYSILSFNGGLSNSENKSDGLVDSRSLSGDFGFRLSYWDNIPFNFNINMSETKDFNTDTVENKLESKDESTSLSLSNNLSFGNLHINSSYSQSESQETKVEGEDSEDDSKNLNIGLSYRRNLTKKLSFSGHTSFHSDLETFEYNPNYNLDFRYRLMSNLRLNLRVDGYQSAKDYRRWNGSISYSRRQLRLGLDINQKNDFLTDEKTTKINLDSTYHYRSIEIGVDTSWESNDTDSSDDLTVTTTLVRRF
jgi:hypothetical protein